MADIQSTVSAYLPKVSIYGSAFVSMIAWLILIAVSIVIIVIIGFMIVNRRNYRNKIVIFEKINGRFVDTGKDKAMEIKFGDLGGKLFYLKKHKKYLPPPRLQSGQRKFYYFIKEDGDWINFELSDFDEQMRQSKAHFLDKEMRYANVGIRKGLAERYKKVTWKEYLPIIVSVGFIVLIGILTWLLFDRWIELAGTTNDGVKVAGEIMDKANTMLGAIDRVCSGGSGIIQK